MTKRNRRSNKTNWNEIALCVMGTMFGVAVLATIAIVQVSSYMSWAAQFKR